MDACCSACHPADPPISVRRSSIAASQCPTPSTSSNRGAWTQLFTLHNLTTFVCLAVHYKHVPGFRHAILLVTLRTPNALPHRLYHDQQVSRSPLDRNWSSLPGFLASRTNTVACLRPGRNLGMSVLRCTWAVYLVKRAHRQTRGQAVLHHRTWWSLCCSFQLDISS